MKDHELAKLTNDLRDIAIKYGHTQQLREQIAHRLHPEITRLRAELERQLAEANARAEQAEQRIAESRRQAPVAWAILDEYGRVDGGLSDGATPPEPRNPDTGIQNWSPLYAAPIVPPDVEEAVKAEREACAAICDGFAARIAELEQSNALYKADAERIWALMPELRNAEAHYELFEAVHEKLRQEAAKVAMLVEDASEEAYMRGRQHLMNELLESKPEAPSYENIKDMLPNMLQGGFKCPLCGKDSPHEHSPTEIIIYRNGVKYGRWIETTAAPEAEAFIRGKEAVGQLYALRRAANKFRGMIPHTFVAADGYANCYDIASELEAMADEVEAELRNAKEV